MYKPGQLCILNNEWDEDKFYEIDGFTFFSLKKAGYFDKKLGTSVLEFTTFLPGEKCLIIKFLSSIIYTPGFYQTVINGKLVCFCATNIKGIEENGKI